ncbi:uncharacterized protein E5676_scaffold506G00880 [Cucumis melo var. makuwa]|uniref:Uncharacterized protein n=1 Tax=Cucumis melo var. makuwa TaxID=1194695 RepID=A0A5D3BFR4_CUCMM|nr:uncharacterized protein E5676_scaffold506G00880 [Cucumis melo var. makuwa]
MVSERNIDQTLNNTTSDGNQTKGTAASFSAVVAAAVDARINAAMDEGSWVSLIFTSQLEGSVKISGLNPLED